MKRKRVLIPIIIFTAIIIFLVIMFNPSTRYNKLSVSESKWSGIQESRTENINLTLEDIRFNDYKLIIDEKENTIYYSVVNDSKNKYNPSVSYSTNSKNIKLAFFADEITDEKVKGDYKFKIMIYDDKEYHIYNLICTNLPILNISYNKNEEIKQKNIPMEMYLFDNLTNIPQKITISSGKIKMNEGEFIFSMHMLTPGKNKRDNKISILGMKPNSEYILTEVTKGEDENNEENNNEPRNHRVELFINNEHRGVYSLGYIQNYSEI